MDDLYTYITYTDLIKLKNSSNLTTVSTIEKNTIISAIEKEISKYKNNTRIDFYDPNKREFDYCIVVEFIVKHHKDLLFSQLHVKIEFYKTEDDWFYIKATLYFRGNSSVMYMKGDQLDGFIEAVKCCLDYKEIFKKYE